MGLQTQKLTLLWSWRGLAREQLGLAESWKPRARDAAPCRTRTALPALGAKAEGAPRRPSVPTASVRPHVHTKAWPSIPQHKAVLYLEIAVYLLV